MLLPLVNPEQQFCDANGVPMAGGTIDTYIPGTDTRKDVWVDLEQTALQTNPIVLDSAGRCLMYGAGDYRLVLKDASGNLIWDQETSAIDKSTLVTMTEVNEAVQTETDRAQAAEDALTTAINTETTRAEAAETTLTNDIAAIQHQLGGGAFQAATSVTNSSGYDTQTFVYPYSGADPFVIAQPIASSSGPTDVSLTVTTSLTGFYIWASDSTGTGVPVGYMWLAFGTY